MKAFHNNPALKEKYVQRMYAHKAADTLIQGEGWNGTSGCNIGCALEEYDHDKYPELIGLPVWLARLQDVIFEELSLKEGIEFASAVFPAIKCGVDVEMVKYKLAILRHKKQLALLEGNNKPYAIECKAAIQGVIDWLSATVEGKGTEEGRVAAYSAAKSAKSAAESAADLASWQWEAETLIRLLKECE